MSDRSVPNVPGVRCLPEFEEYLKERLSTLLRCRRTKFAGSQPVSFTRDHLHKNLLQRDYFVCEKSDGLRVLLFVLVNTETNEEGVFLITRENEFYHIPGMHFPRFKDNLSVPQNGTVVDGELVFSVNPTTKTKEIRYLIFDCLAIDEHAVTTKPLHKRLFHLQMEFHVPYMKLRQTYPDDCKDWPFKVDFKHMSQSFKMSKVFRTMPQLTHVTDGLILTCAETPYVLGTDTLLLKWKPADENTIDFKIGLEFPIFVDTDLPGHDPDREYPDYDSKPKVNIFIWKGGDDPHKSESIEDNIKRNGGHYVNSFVNYEYWSELNITDEQWDDIKATGESFHGRIAECRQNSQGGWDFLRFRDDKLHGNHINIVMKILQSIEDAVTKEELIDMEQEIERAWLEREDIRKRAVYQQQQIMNAKRPQPAQAIPEKRRLDDHHQSQFKAQKTVASIQAHGDDNVENGHGGVIHEGNGQDDDDDDMIKPSTGGGEDDDFYESDGFEELPTYQTSESPKYG
ncbi:mRNA guanylyltransferase [Martiniozyma asiatica (nom. inval.)]|nr:mRNA guanylyltransferase [Martiniozyma asiatica]